MSDPQVEMWDSNIFCPSGHLILDANRCPACGWERPIKGDIGQPAWGPVDIGGPLGIAGSHCFIGWGMIDQVLAFPRNNGGWTILSKTNGEILWQAALNPGQVIRDMIPYGEHLLASINDERDLLKASHAQLTLIDVKEQRTLPLWEASTSSLTPPVTHQDTIIIRDAVKGLVIIDGQPPYDEVISIELEHYSPYAPVILNGQVILCDGSVMHNTVRLKGFDLKSQQQVWESQPIGSMITSFFPLEDRYLIFSPDRRRLVMFDVQQPDKFCWDVNLSKIYTEPIKLGEHLGLVHRGSKDPEAPDHYLFALLDRHTGKVISEHPLEKRADQVLALSDHELILSGYDRDYRGFVLCLDPYAGSILWEHRFEKEADPIQGMLEADDRFLYTATSSGMAFAIPYAARDDQVARNPQALIEDGKYIEAAGIYALDGDYLHAAKLFNEKLNQPEKALLLMERGRFYKEAGAIANKEGWHQRALELFEQAEDQQAQAEVLEAMGDRIEAAKRYQALSQHQKAGRLFEEVGDVVQAFRNYDQAEDEDAVKRLVHRINALPEDIEVNLRDIERCLKWGLLEEAASLALKIRQLERAAKIYQDLGAQEKELETLLALARDPSAGTWVFERLVKLGSDLDRYEIMGHAYQRLYKFQQAGQAFEEAADRILKEQSDQLAAAQYLEKAKTCYEEAGQIDEIPRINRRIIYYQGLPNISIKLIGLDKPLREEDRNYLTLEISNDGFGIAQNILINIKGEDFDFRADKIPLRFPRLAPDLSTTRQVFIRPHDHGYVPLDFEWTWSDIKHKPYKMMMTGHIVVRSLDDTRAGQPNIVYATNWIASGDMITATGDNIMEGGHKGDQAIIGGGRTTLNAQDLGSATIESPAKSPRLCPHCQREITEADRFCNFCGHELKSS